VFVKDVSTIDSCVRKLCCYHTAAAATAATLLPLLLPRTYGLRKASFGSHLFNTMLFTYVHIDIRRH